jgi:hypothetical protein
MVVMSLFKRHFPTFHKAPTLLKRQVPLWTHVPALALLVFTSLVCLYNVAELAHLRRAVVEKERIEQLSAPYATETRSLIGGMTVCRANVFSRMRSWAAGNDVCQAELEAAIDRTEWCRSAWNRWYYGGLGCDEAGEPAS